MADRLPPPVRGTFPKIRKTARTFQRLAVVMAILCCFAGHAAGQGQVSNQRRGMGNFSSVPSLPPNQNQQQGAAQRSLGEVPPGLKIPQPTLPASFQPEQMLSPGGLSSTLNLMILLTVLSLAPSILMMTTCFIRFVIVFGLLRQALGTQQLPPNQVLLSLSLFMTFMVMAPVWKESYETGIRPYTNPQAGEVQPTIEETFNRTALPIRRFMANQIEQAGNDETVWMFIDYQRPEPGTPAAENYRDPETYDEVSLSVLLPAYMLSELKTAFLIGFQLYLPFVIIDMVIAAVLISMGMMMLPPVLVSLPFKLLLFVLINGWGLTVGMMLHSIHP